MALPRTVRLYYLILLELTRKYTRSLVLGFFVGLLLSFLFWKAYPILFVAWVRPPERIGVVGDFSPSTLPQSIQNLLSSGLTTLAEDGSPQPMLASGWEATNSGKTFIFKLTDTETWHNGKTVTAHDVNYNIRGVTLIPNGDDTLTAYLQYPYSPFPTLVSRPIFLPGLKGFGPYELKGININGDSVRSLQLYPVDLSENHPKSFTFYQTEAQAILAFKLGEVDELTELSSSSGFTGWRNVDVSKATKYNRIVTLFFNVRDPKLADKNIRQGLAYGIPNLPFERAFSPISKTSWAYSDRIEKYIYEPELATKLIGHTEIGTTSAQLRLSTFSQYLDIAQSIASSWTDLGVPTTVHVENDVPSDFQVLLSAQDVPPDPDQYLFWHSTQNRTNVTGYVNVKIDKLLEDGRQELDQEKRKKIYEDFQRYLVDDAPAIFLYYPDVYTVKRK